MNRRAGATSSSLPACSERGARDENSRGRTGEFVPRLIEEGGTRGNLGSLWGAERASGMERAGATLLEIMIAMVIIGLIAGGVMTAFVFGRRVTIRSSTELSGYTLIRGSAELLRGAGQQVNPPAGELTLATGIYVDQNMASPPAAGGVNPTPLQTLNLPADFARFLTNEGRTPAPTFANHGDGRVVVVEEAADLDGDGGQGIDFNGDGRIDLRRVRVKVRWTTPTS